MGAEQLLVMIESAVGGAGNSAGLAALSNCQLKNKCDMQNFQIVSSEPECAT